jgi:hypothetical protein
MNVTYYDGNIQICLIELLDWLDQNALDNLIDHLICIDEVIDGVVEQILHGWTKLGSHGSRLASTPALPSSGLDKAIREVAKQSGKVAKREIESLEKELAETKKQLQGEINETGRLRRSLEDRYRPL